jgi:hypothetical protein
MKHWRWLVVAVGITMLSAVPVVSARWPVDEPTIDVATLEARIASSAASAACTASPAPFGCGIRAGDE